MPEVVEAHLGRQPGLCKEASEGTHNRISAADLTLCVREDEAWILPGRRGHPLLELAPLVRLEDCRRSGANAHPPLLAGLGGGDSCPGACVRRAAHGDGAPLRENKVLPPECRKLTLPQAGAQREGHEGFIPRPFGGREQAGSLLVRERAHGALPARGGLLHPGGRIGGYEVIVHGLVRAVERTPC